MKSKLVWIISGAILAGVAVVIAIIYVPIIGPSIIERKIIDEKIENIQSKTESTYSEISYLENVYMPYLNSEYAESITAHEEGFVLENEKIIKITGDYLAKNYTNKNISEVKIIGNSVESKGELVLSDGTEDKHYSPISIGVPNFVSSGASYGDILYSFENYATVHTNINLIYENSPLPIKQILLIPGTTKVAVITQDDQEIIFDIKIDATHNIGPQLQSLENLVKNYPDFKKLSRIDLSNPAEIIVLTK